MKHFRSLARGVLVALALLVAVPGAFALGASPASASTAGTAAPTAPDPKTCPRVQVDSAELVRTVHGPAIQVKGVKPQADTKLFLVAEDVVYVQQPDYWNYFVVGCSGTGATVKTPFTQLFRVPTHPVGKFGITVNGIVIDLFGGPAVV